MMTFLIVTSAVLGAFFIFTRIPMARQGSQCRISPLLSCANATLLIAALEAEGLQISEVTVSKVVRTVEVILSFEFFIS